MSELDGKTGHSRRDFLKAGAAALGAAATGRAALAQEGATKVGGKKIRVGVVGGGFGTSFQWHEHPDSTVEAVSDLIEERRKRLMSVFKCSKSYNSLEELIRDPNVDAVAVFTGAPDHVRHCVACMKAGKHVISAVPAAISIEQAEELLDTVRKTGLTYMMAETSYYQQPAISARKFWNEGKFGNIFYTESEYHHAGLETLWYNGDGSQTWRHSYPPMLYPTHCTAFLVGTTGERLVEVSCIGWGNGAEIMKNNQYNNPFWNETAFFKTDKGHAFRVGIYWYGAHRGIERAQWYGDKMSFFCPTPNGLGAIIVRSGNQTEKDDAGFTRQLSPFEQYEQPMWWKTDMLPEPLRHDSGHYGSHTFLTHEFVDALIHGRKPAIDVYEALAYTVPGIIAHKSALEGGIQLKVPVYAPKT
ncbi:MAG TPA: Gfo/Idh/MocA family oxidoreductase [Candidatus Brocadiia bacterium]|nr:Gfo/Idh/MocA family oxidoreductase [Candidatus Brocadiia bacterium]